MEPQPQLQPIAPRPQLDYAEPTGRPLELKPGPRPLDLRPRPSARPQLDIKYGPSTPAEAAAQRSNPLGNPLNVVKPVVNNPLGYAPGKGLVGAAGALAGRATDPQSFGIPATPLEPLGVPDLPNAFPFDAIAPGTQTKPKVLAQYDVTAALFCHAGGPCDNTITFNTTNRVASLSAESITVSASANKTQPQPLQCGDSHGQTITTSEGSADYDTGAGVRTATKVAVSLVPGAQPDPGETQPNATRRPDKLPAPLSAPGTSPGFEPLRPLLPSPNVNPLPVGFIPYVPTAPSPLPEIKPVRPGQPEEPAKLPPVPTIPGFPTDDPTVPEAPTKRPPPVQFPPSQPGITGPELVPIKPPIIPIIFIPPLKDNNCLTGDEFRRADGYLRDLLEEILDRLLNDCQDLCGEAQLTRVFCEEVEGELFQRQEFQTFQTLAPALGFLSREIAALKAVADPCQLPGSENVAPIVIGSGSMVEGSTVAYVDILPEVRQVELIITGQIPNNLRLYDTTLSGEQVGKFGAITLAYPGVTGGNAPDAFHQWAWTRRTSFYVGLPIRNDRRIRINLKPLLSWVLYDTGLRS